VFKHVGRVVGRHAHFHLVTIYQWLTLESEAEAVLTGALQLIEPTLGRKRPGRYRSGRRHRLFSSRTVN
jgi:hypothetical protein